MTKYEGKIANAEQETARLRAEIQEHLGRTSELSARVKAMLTANEELTTMNAELRTYNEQLLINAEEAASANEEIETLNEEMQATNEELETLNEELQATVEELNTTNDELEARSLELEQANAAKQAEIDKAETQRLALSLALNALGVPSAVVNDRGDVYFISPALAQLTRSEERKDWWRKAGSLALSDGTTYSTKISRLDGGLSLVTFTPNK